MNNYKKLKIWENSIDLAVEIYKLTANFPKEEVYNLTSQIRRSAVSIPSNIAEGAGRHSEKEFLNFLSFSNGSCNELDTQLIIANKLEFISMEDFLIISDKIDHIQKMNFNLRQKLIK
ncbi:MAG: four helix bundle protein [Chitinophagales bacterium]|nr:four helix bundle protein [Chitinophagales bacterium]